MSPADLAPARSIPIERARDVYALALGSGRLITATRAGVGRVLVGTERELRRYCGVGGRFLLGATLAPVPPNVPTLPAAEWVAG